MGRTESNCLHLLWGGSVESPSHSSEDQVTGTCVQGDELLGQCAASTILRGD